MKIFIVEDDETLSEEIAGYLVRWGYETERAKDFANIAQEALSANPELILMDVNLPNFDGFYWCAQIRRASTVPVIFISSRNDDRDKIMGVAQGGDDYVEKPFCLELLKAKIEALLRRTYHYREKKEIDLPVELTKSERRILARLMERRPGVVTREELMQELWSTDEFISDEALTTLVSRLRAKLKEAAGTGDSQTPIICTKKGVGYFIS